MAQTKPIKEGTEFNDSTILNAFSGINRYFEELRKEARITDPSVDTEINMHRMVGYSVAVEARNAWIIKLQRAGHTGKNPAGFLSPDEQERVLKSDYLTINTPQGLVRRVWMVLSSALVSRGELFALK
jgi:hypothetical protein